MKRFIELKNNLEILYQEMEVAFSSFQKSTGLTCSPGCGACCLNPEVEATPLEMLPLAFQYLDRPLADPLFKTLHHRNSCAFYQATSCDGSQGYCSVYAHRPTLCRTFGVGGLAGKSDQDVRLSICAKIKQHSPLLAQSLDAASAPRIDEWQRKVLFFSFELGLGSQQYPINQAFQIMFEKLRHIHSYASEATQSHSHTSIDF